MEKKITGTQARYLIKWLGMEEDKRSMASLAIAMDVTRATAQRMLAGLAARGFLTSDYRPNAQGEEYGMWIRPRQQMLADWFRETGADEETAQEDAWTALTGLDRRTGDLFTRACILHRISSRFQADGAGEIVLTDTDPAEFLADGVYEIGLDILRDGNGEERMRDGGPRSMADEAFEKPAQISVQGKESFLLLKRRRIAHESGLDQSVQSGKMRTMSWSNGKGFAELLTNEDVVSVPARAFRWYCSPAKEALGGYLRAEFTCTIGRAHMPQASAILAVRF